MTVPELIVNEKGSQEHPLIEMLGEERWCSRRESNPGNKLGRLES
jgi:hypothetical protein